MAKKVVRVQNTLTSEVTVNLDGYNGKIIPLRPKGFAKLDESELAYVMNTSEVFKFGTLIVANANELSDEIDTDALKTPNALTDEDIVALLKKAQTTLSKELENIDSEHVVKRILDKAKELDKSVKVVDIIESRLEALIK